MQSFSQPSLSRKVVATTKSPALGGAGCSQPSLSRKVVATSSLRYTSSVMVLATIPQPKGCCDSSATGPRPHSSPRNHPSAERLLRHLRNLVFSGREPRNHPSAERLLRPVAEGGGGALRARNHPSAERLLRHDAVDGARPGLVSQPSLSRKVVATRKSFCTSGSDRLATIPQPKGCCDRPKGADRIGVATRNHPSAERLLRPEGVGIGDHFLLATIPQP